MEKLVGLILFSVCTVWAQTTVPRIEIGTQTVMMRHTKLVTTQVYVDPVLGPQVLVDSPFPKTSWGLGPTVSFRLNRYFALDASYSFAAGVPNLPHQQGAFSALSAGIKGSVDGKRLSFFAKVRPGFVRWGRSDIRYQYPYYYPGVPAATHPSLDIGGGISFAVTRRLRLRVDMSDVVYEPADHFTDKSNHLQISIGPMYSIGRELKFEDARVNSSHRFFDRTNLALFGTSLLAQTADAITTQHFLKACRSYSPGSNCSWKEGDPLARPFVKYGWPGQFGAAVLVNGVQISAVYAIHKMGHHKIERFVTLPFTAVSAWAARDNAKLY